MKTEILAVDVLQLDEIYLFEGAKAKTETHENAYLMTMCSEKPRQIVGFDVAHDRSPERIEKMVWDAPHASTYQTDGYTGYIFVSYPGYHKRNTSNKNDTYIAESINSDIRHYLGLLGRRSRCFPRKLENLKIVVDVFRWAYNGFGQYKAIVQQEVKHKESSKSRHLHKYKETGLSVLDFLQTH